MESWQSNAGYRLRLSWIKFRQLLCEAAEDPTGVLADIRSRGHVRDRTTWVHGEFSLSRRENPSEQLSPGKGQFRPCFGIPTTRNPAALGELASIFAGIARRR
jgi:hypothetical protein